MRVNYMCSNPTCPNFTLKPHSTDPNKCDILGDAAHIKGARPLAKRYDPNMTSKQRKSIENGIWLCKRCHAIVDREPEWTTVELLQCWKVDAELRALNNTIDEDKKQLIINDIDMAVEKINQYLAEYELNSPHRLNVNNMVLSYNVIENLTEEEKHIKFWEQAKVSEDYSLRMRLKYTENVSNFIYDCLFKCRIVLGGSNELVIKSFYEFEKSEINHLGAKRMLYILRELKNIIMWR